MMDKEIIRQQAQRIGVETEALMAFIDVESNGKGFYNGKLLIQFEPKYFHDRTGVWIKNKVDVQSEEWKAFNKAFSINPEAAMESTSIGLGQVMGSNWERLGYSSVGKMWDDAKRGESRQIYQMAQFIKTDRRLIQALKNKNWHKVATYYNGAGYKKLALKLGRVPYDVSMKEAYEKYKIRNHETC